jgi:hypothetical protein
VSAFVDDRPYRDRLSDLRAVSLKKPVTSAQIKRALGEMRSQVLSESQHQLRRFYEESESLGLTPAQATRLLAVCPPSLPEPTKAQTAQPPHSSTAQPVPPGVKDGPTVVWGVNPYDVTAFISLLLGFVGALALPIWWAFGVIVLNPLLAIFMLLSAPIFWIMARIGRSQAQ